MIEADVGPAYAILNPPSKLTARKQKPDKTSSLRETPLQSPFPVHTQTCRMSAKTKHESSQPEWEEHASEGWPSRGGIIDVDRFWWESGTSFDDMNAIGLLFSRTIWSMAFFVTSERPQILGGSCLLSVWRDQVPKKSGVHNLHDFATTRGRVDVDELKKKRENSSRDYGGPHEKRFPLPFWD